MTSARSPLVPALLLAIASGSLVALGPQRATLLPALLPWGIAFFALLRLVAVHRDWLGRPLVLLGGAVLLRLLFFLPLPDLSDDLFRYVWDGVLSLDGTRPYAYVPSDPALESLHGLELYREMNSPDYYSIYPPLSQWVFLLGGQVYGLLGWPAAAWAVKGGFLALETAGVLLLHRALRTRGRPTAPLALYAWNPLVLVAVAGGGHTEGGLVLGLGLLVLGIARAPAPGSAWLAWAGWGLAVLSKGFPLLLAPLVWRALARSRARTDTAGAGPRDGRDVSARGCGPPGKVHPPEPEGRFEAFAAPAGVLAGMGVLTAPFLRPGDLRGIADSAALYVGLFEFNAGLFASLRWILSFWPWGNPAAGLGPALGIGFLGVAGWVVLRHPVESTAQVARAALLVFSAHLLFATTVHPWYLLSVLPFLPFTATLRPAWLWASAASLPTYLTYAGVPAAPLTALFWGGWAVFAVHGERETLLRPLRRLAGRRKARWIAPHLAPGDRLDVGGGEGWVLAALHALPIGRSGRGWVVDPMRPAEASARDGPPRVRADGADLPFEDGAVPSVILSFVLHHTDRPDRVLAEAIRVAGNRVVILETTPRSALGAWCLGRVDRWVNETRGDGSMGRDGSPLRYRSGEAWAEAVARRGGQVVRIDRPNRFGHPVTRLVVATGSEFRGDRQDGDQTGSRSR